MVVAGSGGHWAAAGCMRRGQTGKGRVMMAGARAEQSGGMAPHNGKSVVTGNGGYRGWRHERAVTMPTKEEKERASVVAGGGGHRGWVAA